MSRRLCLMSTTPFPAVDKAEDSDDRGKYECCQTDSKNGAVKAVENHVLHVISAA